MAALIKLLFALSILVYNCDAFKALVVTQMPSKSHAILNDAIVRQLLKDGHEVTYIRSREYPNAPPTLRQIDVSVNQKSMSSDVINLKALMDADTGIMDIEFVLRMLTDVGIKTLANEKVQKLINDPKEHFDVVIAEFMDTDILASLAAVFNCPLIWLTPVEVNSDILRRIDSIPNPGLFVNIVSDNVLPLTFKQRVQELWARIKTEYFHYSFIDDQHFEAYNRLIVPAILKRGRVPPSYEDIRYNASLVLGNSHVSTGEAVRLPQNFKSIGGYHIDGDIEPLPEDLQKIMDDSKDGVIYFSMGTNLKSSEFPEEVKTKLLKMFGGLKQTVIWKFEEQLRDAPKNVHISEWYPQLSILAHPNCVLFLTHGGLLSMAEALHVGIPLIGMPGFADQFINIKRAQEKGFGIKVDMTYNVVEDLQKALEEMTSNPSYRQKAKEFSFVYNDRLVKPNEEMSFWIRHVVETKGAPHLRSPGLDQTIYERLYLDLLALNLISLIIAVILLKVTYCLVLRAIKEFQRNKQQLENKNK